MAFEGSAQRALTFVAGLFALAVGLQAQTGSVDLGSEVRAIFRHRCVECHGAELKKPKGKIGYIEDLDRVREKLVGDHEPEDSDLWLSLTDEFEPMPPKKAKNGPLAPAELDLVLSWLRAGAPAPQATAATAEPEPTTGPDGNPAAAEAPSLGDLHPLVIHFPVALILVAALAELLVWFRGAGLVTTVRFCLFIGAGGAALSALSGWFAAEAGYRDATVFRHRWLGIAATGSSLVAWGTLELARRRDSKTLLAVGRLLLLASALLTGLAGHEGGELVHGPA